MQAPTHARILSFSVLEVDLDAGELRRSGMRQKIAGQPFEVLRILLEHSGELVTREQLQQHIWPKDTFVDYDLALRKAITRLREVLGDSAAAVEQLVTTFNLFGWSDAAAGMQHAFAASGFPGAMREFGGKLESLQDAKQGFFPKNLAAAYAAIGRFISAASSSDRSKFVKDRSQRSGIWLQPLRPRHELRTKENVHGICG